MTTKTQTYRTFEDFPAEDLYLYAGTDCIVTSELLSKLWPKVAEEPEYYYYLTKNRRVKGIAPSLLYQMEVVEMKAFDFLCDLTLNGMAYDIKKNREFASRMVAEAAELEDGIFTGIGKKIDLDSNKELSTFLYGEKGFTAPYQTRKGQDALDGDALKELSKTYGHSWLNLMAKRRDIVSVYRTFVENYATEFVKSDGRIHPTYSQIGTSSFRITGNKPNLTQLPNPKHGYNLRQCFTVDPGNVFIAFDFSSCEVKILGALSKDPALLKAIELGMDFHSYSACSMRGLNYSEFVQVLGEEDKSNPLYSLWKSYRQAAKALTFGILYGSSEAGIARTMGISIDQARHLISLYFKTYPKIKEYVECSHEMAKVNKFVITPFGQRKMEYGVLPVFQRTAVYNADLRNAQNVRIQSTASTLGLDCFSEFNLELKRRNLGKCVCTVYDSIEVEAPIEKAAEVIELGYQYLDDLPVERYDWLTLPIGTDAEIGFNWGDVHKVHRGVSQDKVLKILRAA